MPKQDTETGLPQSDKDWLLGDKIPSPTVGPSAQKTRRWPVLLILGVAAIALAWLGRSYWPETAQPQMTVTGAAEKTITRNAAEPVAELERADIEAARDNALREDVEKLSRQLEASRREVDALKAQVQTLDARLQSLSDSPKDRAAPVDVDAIEARILAQVEAKHLALKAAQSPDVAAQSPDVAPQSPKASPSFTIAPRPVSPNAPDETPRETSRETSQLALDFPAAALRRAARTYFSDNAAAANNPPKSPTRWEQFMNKHVQVSRPNSTDDAPQTAPELDAVLSAIDRAEALARAQDYARAISAVEDMPLPVRAKASDWLDAARRSVRVQIP